ncbi:MAG TPA: transcription antitermination factor NusB [Pirellulaceae bacterium]|nr:transcription antitermination factor NusB [Pirellulaceae bacterium]
MKRSKSRITPLMRRRARKVAAQTLFQDLFHAGGAWEWREFVTTRLRQFADVEGFCQSLVLGVREQRSVLNSALQAAIPNWNLTRLAKIDLAILLMGSYELMFTETPYKVAIDEAIELARSFGGEDSPSFINGVLDRVWRSHSAPGNADTHPQ